MLRITNAGPYSGERNLDVSRAAAAKLGFHKEGTASLVISVMQSPTKADASYVKRREYPKVPGYIGRFATVDVALEAAQARFDLDEEGEQLADDTGVVLEESSLENGLVPRPQLAVSPSLARELVMLRLPPRTVSRGVRLLKGPRLVSRGVRLVQGPRLASRAAFREQQLLTPTGATKDDTWGLRGQLLHQ